MDFGLKQEDLAPHADAFIKHIESTFEMRDRIGFAEDSLEFRFNIDKVPTDLFIVYKDKKKGQDYLPGVDFNRRQEIRWYLPHISDLCAGSLLDSLIHVACNVKEVLEADYGKNWTLDKVSFPPSQPSLNHFSTPINTTTPPLDRSGEAKRSLPPNGPMLCDVRGRNK